MATTITNKTSVSWVFVVFFTALSTGGEGLHRLSGCGHHHRGSAHTIYQVGQLQCCQNSYCQLPDNKPPSGYLFADEDCLVCKFLAQAKQPGFVLGSQRYDLITSTPPNRPTPIALEERFVSYASRAPPAHV